MRHKLFPYQDTILQMIRAAIRERSDVQVSMVLGTGRTTIAIELALWHGEGTCVCTPLVMQQQYREAFGNAWEFHSSPRRKRDVSPMNAHVITPELARKRRPDVDLVIFDSSAACKAAKLNWGKAVKVFMTPAGFPRMAPLIIMGLSEDQIFGHQATMMAENEEPGLQDDPTSCK